jgi:hypothetical protein
MARVVADLMEVVGICHVITVDLHTPQTEGFFSSSRRQPDGRTNALLRSVWLAARERRRGFRRHGDSLCAVPCGPGRRAAQATRERRRNTGDPRLGDISDRSWRTQRWPADAREI